MSGKGGVGKSFVTAGLARALARQGRATGVLGADFNGPTAARLLEARDARVRAGEGAVYPTVGTDGAKIPALDQLLEAGHPLGIRGPEAEGLLSRRPARPAAPPQ